MYNYWHKTNFTNTADIKKSIIEEAKRQEEYFAYVFELDNPRKSIL